MSAVVEEGLGTFDLYAASIGSTAKSYVRAITVNKDNEIDKKSF